MRKDKVQKKAKQKVLKKLVRKKGSKFNFMLSPKKKVMHQPYVFTGGDIPHDHLDQLSNGDREPKDSLAAFHTKQSLKTAADSILA